MTNCKNCGAVLKGSVCEYCGTNYEIKYTPVVLPSTLYKEAENNKAIMNAFAKCGVTLLEFADECFNAF